MKTKLSLLLLAGLMIGLIVNSCKKSAQTSIQTLFTGGYWQLASVQVTYFTGNTQDSVATLNTTCNFVQKFTFNIDNTCTYTYFDCVNQPTASGHWSLAQNQLYLISDIVCKDTTAAGSSKPFEDALIQNLGQFSLVLKTGDIQPNYSLTKKRKIIQYGFIRQTSM
jgi:hypothetical protein